MVEVLVELKVYGISSSTIQFAILDGEISRVRWPRCNAVSETGEENFQALTTQALRYFQPYTVNRAAATQDYPRDFLS